LLNRKKCKTATGKEKALRLKALLQNESKITMGFHYNKALFDCEVMQ
jgi:hypothetical protein